MSGLSVGGTVIPIAVGNITRARMDAVDRSSAFDGTYRASLTGGARRDFHFQTPPVTRALADTYEPVLATVAAQLCSGDIVSIPTMCCAEIVGWTPVATAQGHSVVINFVLHEVQPARRLLSYTPGDSISGEAFTGPAGRYYQNNGGTLVSVGVNVKRDSHFAAGVRTLLLEGARTNGLIRSQEFDNAAWTKGDTTITANIASAPDATATGDKIIEAATTAEHVVYQGTTTTASTVQAYSIHATAGERTWIWVRTTLRDATTPTSWINLNTGAVGTKAAGHTIRTTQLVGGWWRIEVVVNSGAGAGATFFVVGTATADNVSSFLGDVTKGLSIWGAQHEQDKPFATSYIPTTTVAVTRTTESYSLPFTTPPQEMSVYTRFIEEGTVGVASAGVFGISSAGVAAPLFSCFSTGTVYRVSHNNNVATVQSDMAVAPTFVNVVELNARLFGDGSVDDTQSISTAASTSGTQSAANALATAWSGLLCWLNSNGSANQGFIAIQNFRIVSGMRSLAEQRLL